MSRLALVLGAGASWAAPSARPLFGDVQQQLFDGLGLTVETDRRWLMAPEALLSRLAARGVDIDAELRAMLEGGAPNALHFAAAQALSRGASVWTPNFDELIEKAAEHLGVDIHRLVIDERDPACDCRCGHLLKVHGSLSGETVLARSDDVLESLPEPWTSRLRRDFEGAQVGLVGYAGADIDLRAALQDALAAAAGAQWFDIQPRRADLEARFGRGLEAGRLQLSLTERPDLSFLDWARQQELTARTPEEVDALTRGPLPERELPKPAIGDDELLRGLVADDFGDFHTARTHYRRALVSGPDRRRAGRCLLSTGLIHGALWRPAATGLLRAACALPTPLVWPHQQLILYLTWNGRTASAWHVAQRALRRFDDDHGLRLQAANLAKECEPREGVRLSRLAQAHALEHRQARQAAWATLCLSLSLRWVGEIEQAAEQAARLAGGLDALAAPVWRAWGHFELGAVAALSDRADDAVAELRQAREVFAAAGAENFVFDALCAELAAERQRVDGHPDRIHRQARAMLDRGLRTSRYAREVLLVEEGELARAAGQLETAEAAYTQVLGSPTAAQAVLGLAEVERTRGEEPRAARAALTRSRELGFAFGEVHAAITLGLAGALAEDEVERIIASSAFTAPHRIGHAGLTRFCLGPEPERHALSFP